MPLTTPRSERAPWSLGCFLIAFILLATCASARAESVTVDATVAPIVRITIAAGDVTVRTWDRSSVEVDGDASLSSPVAPRGNRSRRRRC